MVAAAVYSHQRLFKEIGRAEAEKKYRVKEMVLGPRMPIRTARNLMVKTAMDAMADRLMMIDDDMVFKPNILDILLDADKDIVGGLCFNSKGDACSFVDDGAGSPVVDTVPPRTGLYQRLAVGTGAMMIKVEVLREIGPPWFYYEKTGNTMDVNFCMDAGRKGFEVWCSSDAVCRQLVFGHHSAPLPWGDPEGKAKLVTFEDLNS